MNPPFLTFFFTKGLSYQKKNVFALIVGNVILIYTLKSHIRETKHLLTDADSSTNTTVGCTKNIQKPFFFGKTEKSLKTKTKSKTSRNMPKLPIRPSTRGLESNGKRCFWVDQE